MTEAVHKASYFEPDRDERVRCTLCPHECRIAEGFKGACGVRVNHRGTLYTLVYDRVVARHVEPIEKKPFFHFLPGSIAYSIGTVGCSLRCTFCQNSEISQWPKSELPRKLEWATGDDPEVGCPKVAALGKRIPGQPVAPAKIVRAALDAGLLVGAEDEVLRAAPNNDRLAEVLHAPRVLDAAPAVGAGDPVAHVSLLCLYLTT